MRLEKLVTSIISAERPAAAKAVSKHRHTDLASNVSSARSESSKFLKHLVPERTLLLCSGVPIRIASHWVNYRGSKLCLLRYSNTVARTAGLFLPE